MEQNYEYYAFISYKREDEKCAKWLHRKLENYRLPSVVCKEIPRLPKRVKPVFMDTSDLGAGELTANIHSEMERSRYLIVICSPRSAQSEWVGKEISYFKALGRYEQIIPFIVDGEPNSENPALECFNPALKEDDKELLGVNISEIGKEQAFIKVVAKLLDIRFDALWGRERRRQRRNNIYKVIAALLIALVGLFVWNYKRPYYEYYADYVDKWGVPEGIIELNREQCSRRSGMYRFEYRRVPFGSDGFWSWRLSQVDFVNSAGTVIEHSHTEFRERFAIQKLIFDKENRDILLQTNYCNKSDIVMLRYKYSQYNERLATIVDFIQSQEQMGQAFISAATTSITMNIMDGANCKAKITRYIYDRDDNGYIIKKSYRANNDLDSSKSKICDADGVAGSVYELDSLGRISSLSYIDMDNALVSSKIGIQSKKYRYDNYGNICESSYLDLNGALILNEEKWAKCIGYTNGDGNIVRLQYLDSDSKPCFNINNVAEYIIEYDSHGNAIKKLCLGIDGKLCLNDINVAGIDYLYDSDGNEIQVSFFDINRESCLNSDNVAKGSYKYDLKGNIIKCTYFGLDGNPCLHIDSISGYECEYNPQGYLISSSCFGIDGNPCLHIDGISGYKCEYNMQGNLIKLLCFGIDGKPCLHKNGYAGYECEYNPQGNEIKCSFFGIDGSPCLYKDGFSGYECEYNPHGNEIKRSFFGIDGNPCLINDKYASWQAKYNQGGKCLELSYYGLNRELVMTSLGYARIIYEYDNNGICIKQRKFDQNNILIIG